MTKVFCDHCKDQISDVAYVLMAMDSDQVDSPVPINGRTHLHWKCVPLYGRSSVDVPKEELPF